MAERAPRLVGRDREVELLGALLEDVSARSPRFAFVSGEPGIGKTRLLAELRRQAEERGWLTLHGSAAEFERELPFGVVVDAFDEYLESLDPQAFKRLATEDLHELAGVFPALRSLGPGSEEPSTPAERFRAHRAVRDLAERLAARQAVILTLDDLHWADGASIELISYLLRHPPHGAVMVAGTLRRGQLDHALSALIERLANDAHTHTVRRVELGPLTPADAKHLVEVSAPGEFERLYRASGGNPLYLLQLTRLGHGEEHESGGRDDGGGVPAAVAAGILSELDALSARARQLAEAAAVTGDPFELDLTMAAAAMAESDALEALDELIARDLVRAEQVPRRFRVRHPLVRRAVYESCPPGARITLHGRTAAALAERGATATTRAYHVQHSARHGDLAAVRILREAGEAAMRRAPISAARWFETAIGLLPENSPAAERVELLMACASARAATGAFEDSRVALLQGIELTPEGDDVRRVKLTGACAGIEQLLGHHEEAHARLTSALQGLSDASSPLAVELRIQLAVGGFFRMDYEGMADWGARALSVAHQLADLPLMAASTAVMAVAKAFIGATGEADRYCAGAASLVNAAGDHQLAVRVDALANLATAELYLHRYADAGEHAERGLAIARATGQSEISPVLIPVLSNVLHSSGRIAEAAELLDGAVDGARLSGNVQALGWNLLSRSFAGVAAGDLDLALRVAEESVEITRDLDDSLVSTYAGVALASALYESGDARRAIHTLLTAAGGEELPLIAGGWRIHYFELLTRCWLSLGQLAAAQRAAERATTAAAKLQLPLALAMAKLAASAVCLEAGDAAAAAEQGQAAADEADRVGARVEAARARILAGSALARAGDPEGAVTLLERAAQDLDGFGALRYRQQAERELRKLGRHIHRRTRPGKVGGVGIETLTEREAEIARLVADRHTNPQIAAELFLSIKTIETHMRNIFRKLNVSSRVEVARSLERVERTA